MCGIAGYIDRASRVDERTVRGMCALMRHRGPDDEGIYGNRNICMGMRRLSIIDVAGGHQPMFNEDGSVCIVFNGEIYNFRELHGSLAGAGHNFKTRSDTEVIVHQYEESGPECVHALNGMFGFALWDERKKTLLLARDRLGIKPLYYYFDGRRLLFASEIKSLLAPGCITPRMNMKAVWDYLTFKYVPEPDTVWQGIKKLPPGHRLVLDAERWTMKVERYWDIPCGPEEVLPSSRSEARCLEEFAALFEDAVSRHLQADVPVGVFLSGGLDSTAVLAAVKRVHNQDIYSFSVAFSEGGEFDELKYARMAARSFGAINHEVVIGHREFTDFLPELLWHTDEPLADPACVPLHYVSKLASAHVKVVLSGEGGDEVLGGYNFQNIVRRLARAAFIERFPRVVRKRLLRYMFGRDATLTASEIAALKLFSKKKAFSEAEKRGLFGGSPTFGDSMDTLREYHEKVRNAPPLHQVLYVMSKSWLVEDLLMKADKVTMASSLELRVPFLDYRIVEWAARAPASMKVGLLGGKLVTKKVLRMYSADKVPQEIIDRPKRGFPVPVYGWLSNVMKPYALDMLGRGCRLEDIFDSRALASSVLSGTRADAKTEDRHKLWMLLVLEIWMRRWAQGGEPLGLDAIALEAER